MAMLRLCIKDRIYNNNIAMCIIVQPLYINFKSRVNSVYYLPVFSHVLNDVRVVNTHDIVQSIYIGLNKRSFSLGSGRVIAFLYYVPETRTLKINVYCLHNITLTFNLSINSSCHTLSRKVSGLRALFFKIYVLI